MPRRSSLLFGVAFVALLILASVWFLRSRSATELVDSETSEGTSAGHTASPAATSSTRERREAGYPALAAVTPAPLSNPEDRSPLADSLHAPTANGNQDLVVVLELFEFYQRTFGSLPSGESNAQLVNALTGNNPQRLALIERSHPAINPQGELTDRWGTPLFFHLIARDALEIRSAGPDKALWSDDDLITASPRLRAQKPEQ